MTKKSLNTLIKEAVQLTKKLSKLLSKIDKGVTDRNPRLGK